MRMASLCYSATFISAQAVGAQPENPAAREVKAGWFRVVAPTGAVSEKTYERVVRAVRSQSPLPGLPPDVLQRQQVTISLASRMRADIVAWSSTSDGLVVLRLSDAEVWQDEVLYRNLRHELAHIGLSRYLNFASVPRWFAEGYSEFAVGSVSCAGEVRLGLFFRLGRSMGDRAEPNAPFGDIEDSRVAYDAFASFFEFLEASLRSSVTGGRMFADVRRYGVEDGLRRTFGVGFEELERRWRARAAKEYSRSLDVSTARCTRP